MNGLIAGLDLSLTSTGIVVLDPAGTIQTADAIKPETKGTERLVKLHQEIKHKAIDHIRLWVIEGYAYGVGKGSSLADLAEIGGVVKWWLYFEEGCPFIVVPPARLKKFVCGKGNAKKDEMRLAVYKRWKFEHESHDVVDAYALAQLGRAYLDCLGFGEKLTKAQAEVLQDLRKTKGGSLSERRNQGTKMGAVAAAEMV